MRQLTAAEQSAIRQLQDLAAEWPMSLMLFSQSGSLLVVDQKTWEVVEDLSGIIPNDGGDRGIVQDIDGNTFLNRWR